MGLEDASSKVIAEERAMLVSSQDRYVGSIFRLVTTRSLDALVVDYIPETTATTLTRPGTGLGSAEAIVPPTSNSRTIGQSPSSSREQ